MGKGGQTGGRGVRWVGRQARASLGVLGLAESFRRGNDVF
jgi:hypothetical protein